MRSQIPGDTFVVTVAEPSIEPRAEDSSVLGALQVVQVAHLAG